MSDQKSTPKTAPSLSNSPKEVKKEGGLADIIRDLSSTDERRRREALFHVNVNR